MKQTTVVVFGGNGMLADSFREILEEDTSCQAYFFGKDIVDITKFEEIDRVLASIKPTFVINCAAYTHVNPGEIQFEKMYNINLLGAVYVAKACKKHNIPLIHIDSCFAKDPVNEYGMAKKLAAYSVKQILQDQVYIPMLGWLFGSRKDNQFTNLVLTSIRNGRALQITDKTTGNPTYTLDAVRHMLQRFKEGARGEEEVGNKGCVTRWEYCRKIFAILGRENTFTIAKDFFEFAKRPKDMSIEATLRPYEEAMKEFLTKHHKDLFKS